MSTGYDPPDYGDSTSADMGEDMMAEEAPSVGETQATDSGTSMTMPDFTSAEGMVSLAGAVLIVTYLVFGLILNEYWVPWLALMFAVLAVLLPRMGQGFTAKIAPMPVLMKTVGYLMVLIGVFVIIEDIRFAGNTYDEFLDVIGALASYAGYALAFMGARGIET